MDAVVVDVDPNTFKADVAATRKKCNKHTVLLVGSACSYAHGVVDPIEQLGALALENVRLLRCVCVFIL